jgi:1-acyl-sn-glycerol-3-phosphate acyltransferase
MSQGQPTRRSAASPRPGVAALLARQVERRIPPADLEERDPEYIQASLAGLWLLASFYFRARVRGMHRVPVDGPVLLVGNHSGGNVPVDTFVFTLAFSAYFGAERQFFQLAHNLVMVWPFLGFLRKYGTVAASPANARRALDAGAAVLVYPGGDRETHRPSWQSHRIDFDRREGFIALALERDVPVVPVVSIGGQETALFLSRGERLARALRLDRTFHLHVLPISLALPWGLNVGDLLGHLPLPVRITIQLLEPIRLRDRFGDDPDLDDVYDHLTALMQHTLDDLAARPRPHALLAPRRQPGSRGRRALLAAPGDRRRRGGLPDRDRRARAADRSRLDDDSRPRAARPVAAA